MTILPLSAAFAAAADEAARAVRDFTIPLFHRASDDAVDFEGSGVLVRLGDGHFLFSAAHVFSSLTDGIFLLAEGREQHPLSQNATCVRDDAQSHDLLDVGFVPLTSPEVAALGPGNFLPAERLASLEADGQTPAYLAVGYPDRFQIPRHCEQVYLVNGIHYHALESKPDAYKLVGVGRESHVMIRYNKNRTRGPKGTGGSPKLRGMSGCGVWRLNPFSRYSRASPPELVAIFTERPTRYGKALLSTRVGVLLAALYHHHPQYRGVAPLSPAHEGMWP